MNGGYMVAQYHPKYWIYGKTAIRYLGGECDPIWVDTRAEAFPFPTYDEALRQAQKQQALGYNGVVVEYFDGPERLATEEA